MDKLTPAQHKTRAIVGMSCAFALATIPAIGLYLDRSPATIWFWVVLMLLSLPVVGYGATHLAEARGYSGGAGCGVCVIGYLVSAFLRAITPHPWALGVGMAFIVALPLVVFLGIPNKNRRHRHHHHHHRRREAEHEALPPRKP